MPPDLADLKSVALLAGRAEDIEHTLGAALEALAEVIEYDLAAVLALDGEVLRVRCARGRLNSAQVREHHIDLNKAPALRAALQSGRPRIFLEADHDHATGGDGDPYHGVVELPHGHACLVAPLIAGGRTIGLMTFDRAICQRYDEASVALVTVYAQLVAMAMALALRNAELEQLVRLRKPAPTLPPDLGNIPTPFAPTPVVTLEQAERAALSAALTAAGGKVYGNDGAAALLGIPPSTLQHRMRKLNLIKSALK